MQTYLFQSGSRAGKRNFWKIFFLLGLLTISAKGQDILRAGQNLKKLSSARFAGRGYLEDGHVKAAGFIQKAFREMGLQPVQNTYFQPFEISQNLFPSNPKLSLNGKKKLVGLDYLPSPECPSVSGKYLIRRLDSIPDRIHENIEKDRAWLLSPKAVKQWQSSDFRKKGIPKIILQEEKKLTHSLAEGASSGPRVLIKMGTIGPLDSVLRVSIKTRVAKVATQNVIGMVRGTRQPDSFLVVCAHYDHLGKIGKSTLFPGANDNASGIAFMLEFAAYFSKNPLPYSLVFIAFSGEEAGLLGSYHFVNNPLIPLHKIRFVINLDLLGFGEKGATVVNASLHEAEFNRLLEINKSKNYLPEIKARGKAANSDHFPFSEKGVPAFFLYTLGGPGFYHDIDDKAESVTFSRFAETFGLVRDFLIGF